MSVSHRFPSQDGDLVRQNIRLLGSLGSNSFFLLSVHRGWKPHFRRHGSNLHGLCSSTSNQKQWQMDGRNGTPVRRLIDIPGRHTRHILIAPRISKAARIHRARIHRARTHRARIHRVRIGGQPEDDSESSRPAESLRRRSLGGQAGLPTRSRRISKSFRTPGACFLHHNRGCARERLREAERRRRYRYRAEQPHSRTQTAEGASGCGVREHARKRGREERGDARHANPFDFEAFEVPRQLRDFNLRLDFSNQTPRALQISEKFN